jgi:lauroyl/myristoyl acyltransferase
MLACVEFDGEERVISAHGHGRGVLLFTGHFGFWEINALVHALTLKPMAVLARPLDNPLLHDLLEEPFELIDGAVSAPERPGLGIRLRRDVVRSFTV